MGSSVYRKEAGLQAFSTESTTRASLLLNNLVRYEVIYNGQGLASGFLFTMASAPFFQMDSCASGLTRFFAEHALHSVVVSLG